MHHLEVPELHWGNRHRNASLLIGLMIGRQDRFDAFSSAAI